MRLAYVNVSVNDLTRAIPLYQSTLGLELTMSAPEYSYAAFNAGAIKLAIVARRSRMPTGRATLASVEATRRSCAVWNAVTVGGS